MPSMAYLTIRIKGEEGYTQQELEGHRVTVGRSSKAGVTIDHGSISREHCALVREGDGWKVEDLGSSNGTRVNRDDKLDAPRILEERDIVKIGRARLTFHGSEFKLRQDSVPKGINLSGDDVIEASAPVQRRGGDDPAEAFRCGECGTWLSAAHHLPNETMKCPRCRHENKVPALETV